MQYIEHHWRNGLEPQELERKLEILISRREIIDFILQMAELADSINSEQSKFIAENLSRTALNTGALVSSSDASSSK